MTIKFSFSFLIFTNQTRSKYASQYPNFFIYIQIQFTHLTKILINLHFLNIYFNTYITTNLNYTIKKTKMIN